MTMNATRELTRIIAFALAVAALLAVSSLGSGVRPAEALTNCTVSDMTFDAEEQEFLRLINQYRAQNGRGALTASVNLNRGASWMARDLAVNRYFSHTDSLGRSVGTRLSNCDAKPSFGENIAAGTNASSAAAAFEMWRKSSGHNANMLKSTYRQIGIARYYDASSPYRWYWVTDFSTSVDGTDALSGGSSGGGGGTSPSPTPTPTPTATPPAATTSPKAVMTSPANGSTLSTTARFTWTAGHEAQGYHFYMGTTPGSGNLVNYGVGQALQLTINGIPRTGQTVYVRLWTLTPSGWQYNDYTYKFPR